jgi:glycosyltransferase involved in cell wall biosynthesis
MKMVRGPFEIQQKIRGKILKHYVRSRLERFTVPDVIVSQGLYFPQIGDLARDSRVPHLVFIRDQFYRCPGAMHRPCDGRCFPCVPTGQKVLWPLVKNLINQKKKGVKNATMVLTNSLFMKRDIEKHVNKTVNVLFPPVEFPFKEDGGSHDKIVYMGCGYWKGTKLVMDMSRRMFPHKFLVAGDPEVPVKYDLSKYPNVEWVPWIDRNVAFDNARVLLFPSYWPEPFGRIPVEAGTRGIPTVGSNRGGIPESVGDGGVLLDPDKVHDWVKWTRTLMECDVVRNGLGNMAREHSVQFGISRIGPRLEGFLSQLDEG